MTKESKVDTAAVAIVLNSDLDFPEKERLLSEFARCTTNLTNCEKALQASVVTSNARAQELGFAERRIQVALAVLECDRPMVLEDIAAVIWPAPGPPAGLTDSDTCGAQHTDLSQIPTGSPGEETFLGGRFIKTL